jgi:hypothetical protein
MSTRNPPLTVVGPGTTAPAPPRTLNPPGLALWTRIQAEYAIRDAGGIELLCLACEATDRAVALAGAIDADGLTLRTRTGIRAHPALRDELAARALAARLLVRLGVTTEQIKSPGRPSSGLGWIPPA